MSAICRPSVVLCVVALTACATTPLRPQPAAAATPAAHATPSPSVPAAPGAAAHAPAQSAPGAATLAASTPLVADPRIARAAALASRTLGEPTPQQTAVREGRPAPAFDREAYLDDPASYLDAVDGLRAVSPAQPEAGVPVIAAVDGTGYRVPSGGTATLRVRAEPGFPVSFATTGLGRFASGFDAITVAADASGIAEAVFIASRDTNAQVPIHVASPVCSGVLNLLVQVE